MTRHRILVVDDEPGMLRAVRRILSDRHDVETAASAEEALELVQRWPPELAILDVRMPGVDGFELMRRLQRTRPGIDVILMTGSVADSDRKLVRAIRQKAFYFVQKPFDREVLQLLVERCLELRRMAEQNRRHLERLENVLAEARAFQTGLLPPPRARVGGGRIDARCTPCEALGGDLFDFAPAGKRDLALLIADVSGHGAPAAMLTGVVKSAFHSCQRDGFDPTSVVERIATGIGGFRDNRFVSLFCGRLDRSERRLDYVNAGHPPAFVWNEGRAERPLALDSTGPIISPSLPIADWKQESVSLDADCRLLLYTDGVTEASGPSGMFGERRLLELLAGSYRDGAELLERIERSVAEFAQGRPAADDLTLLTFRSEE